ncbi:MAG: D-alanyl-D-alanine carboxypeptidase [Peptococcaceae bacterium]|nr:D-alanyl-D-alanine carboxypeptidase [Peptococcaceae bacterium]
MLQKNFYQSWLKCFGFTLLLGYFSLGFAASTFALECSAKGAVLIDAETGQILWEQNSHVHLPPASTTKVLTALLALENGYLTEVYTVPEDFVNDGEASIWLEPGERQSLENLMYAMLLRSANDSAQIIAIGIAGSQEKFVDMMNEKAASLGLADSHFVTPNGLHHDDHYTSAYDLAMITREAIKYPLFNQIVVTNRWQLPWADNDYDRVVYNRNQLLDIYEYADGIKNGYTKEAGNCLVSSATKDGMRLIAVVLNCPNMYEESKSIFEYGFATYERQEVAMANAEYGNISVVQGKQKEIPLLIGENAYLPVKKGMKTDIVTSVELSEVLSAPIKKGDVIGSITYENKADGAKVTVSLLAGEHVLKHTFWGNIKEMFLRILRFI